VEKIRAEQIAEAAALASLGAEQELAREAKRRAEQETAAGHAAAARLEAEREAGLARAQRAAAEKSAASAATATREVEGAIQALQVTSPADTDASPPVTAKSARDKGRSSAAEAKPITTPSPKSMLTRFAVGLVALVLGLVAGVWMARTSPGLIAAMSGGPAEPAGLRLDDNLDDFSSRVQRMIPRDAPKSRR
jgi:cobalamin biosynthesis Mg chelatase CobN